MVGCNIPLSRHLELHVHTYAANLATAGYLSEERSNRDTWILSSQVPAIWNENSKTTFEAVVDDRSLVTFLRERLRLFEATCDRASPHTEQRLATYRRTVAAFENAARQIPASLPDKGPYCREPAPVPPSRCHQTPNLRNGRLHRRGHPPLLSRRHRSPRALPSQTRVTLSQTRRSRHPL